jgi:Holliday junction resolvasome RuvABC ATP-dependent DNA helicase subunit
MLRCMVFGFAEFCSQDFELGAFAALDYSGSSIRSLKIRIDQIEKLSDFTVKTSTDSRSVVENDYFDLKNQLQKAMNNLKMDEWGLDYNDFKRLPIIDQVNIDLENQKMTLESIVSVLEMTLESIVSVLEMPAESD